MENINTNLINLTSGIEKSNADLLVSGELYNSGCSLFGTEITLYDNDLLSQKFICCLNGFFYFKLDYNKIYKIVVSKSGFETKTIVFNTNLFGYAVKKRYYDFGVSLSPRSNDSECDTDESPAAIINYIPKKEIFEHDIEYIKQRQLKYKKAA